LKTTAETRFKNAAMRKSFIDALRAFIGKKTRSQTQRQIDHGEAAMRRLIRTGKDQIGAMRREELGAIDFLWGTEKFGARHVLKRRAQQVAALGGQNGEKVLSKVPTVIMRAKLPEGFENEKKITLCHDGYNVTLSIEAAVDTSRMGRRQRKKTAGIRRAHWVFTAYDISEVRANSRNIKKPRGN
jgi:hypothetical protein